MTQTDEKISNLIAHLNLSTRWHKRGYEYKISKIGPYNYQLCLSCGENALAISHPMSKKQLMRYLISALRLVETERLAI